MGRVLGPELVWLSVSLGEGSDTVSLMEFGFDAAWGEISDEVDTASGARCSSEASGYASGSIIRYT